MSQHVPFETALHCIKNGSKATRSGWQGSTCIFMIDQKMMEDPELTPNNQKIFGLKPGRAYTVKPYIMQETRVKNEYIPYTPTQEDLVSEDWKVI